MDLRAHFPSAWAVRCSLGTSDLREANEKAKRLQSNWSEQFKALRTGEAVPVDLAALRAKLLLRVETGLPAVDAKAAGLDKDEREKRAGDIAWLLGEAKEGLQNGYVPDWAEDWIDSAVEHRSKVADSEAMAALVLQLELQREAIEDVSRTYPERVAKLTAKRALIALNPPVTHDAATGIKTPTANSRAARRRIADALEAWSEIPRPPKTVAAFTRHAKQFTAMADDPILDSFDKAAAIRFKNSLQTWAIETKKTARTADNVLVSVRALFNVARDRGWISGNPLERLSVEVGGKESEPREPWTLEELSVLFDDPIWTLHELPNDRKAGGEAAYWIPLIACYSGARVSEIAQLWKDDLLFESGAEVIEFRDNTDREQRLKTDGSWRAVPIHSELLRLGLAAYVATLPAGSLFPYLPTEGDNGAGGQFSQWFGDFKRAKGFTSSAKTLHSFRHLVATELRLAGATDAQADAITGHAGEGVGRKVYAATIRREANRLRSTIELLKFPELKLPSFWS